MKLANDPRLDALCGEYLVGTLRGRARRRFERALSEEPPVALRLRHWEQTWVPKYSEAIAIQPARAGWKRLERELQLARYRPGWFHRVGIWRAWAVAATLAFVVAIGLPALLPLLRIAEPVEIARLQSADNRILLHADLSRDRRMLRLRSARPVIAGPTQSYELWLLPAERGAPISLAVLGALDAQVTIPRRYAEGLRAGAKLAVSIEPAGGSPTGAPTGPVILVGDVRG
jgi:anti-sigma-K factor RskA